MKHETPRQAVGVRELRNLTVYLRRVTAERWR
jgi:hypothetical protein